MSNSLTDITDHPVIQNLMATGFPDGREQKEHYCPACGEECQFFGANDEIIGCENCVSMRYADDIEE